MNPNTILALLLLIFALFLSLGFFSCFFRMKNGEMFNFLGGVLALFLSVLCIYGIYYLNFSYKDPAYHLSILILSLILSVAFLVLLPGGIVFMILSTEKHGNVRRGYEPEIGVFATVSFIGSLLCGVGSLYFYEQNNQKVVNSDSLKCEPSENGDWICKKIKPVATFDANSKLFIKDSSKKEVNNSSEEQHVILKEKPLTKDNSISLKCTVADDGSYFCEK